MDDIPGTEPCENCGTPVAVIQISALNENNTKLYELSWPGIPGIYTITTQLYEHTPQRCREARKKTYAGR